ncbi:MAG TPA: RHS repeat-associated core domain-containing protein, partial [Bryobacteraceae bacterium]
DPELYLYYLRARYFNPLSGRLLSKDPEAGRVMAPATFHAYLYTHVDPVNGSDPTGRAAMFEYVNTNAKESLATVRRQMSLGRCVLGAYLAIYKILVHELTFSLTNVLGGIGTLSGCISAFFPNAPF